MTTVHVVVLLIVAGFLLWLVNEYIPMERTMRGLVNVVAIGGVVYWLLQHYGVLGRWK